MQNCVHPSLEGLKTVLMLLFLGDIEKLNVFVFLFLINIEKLYVFVVFCRHREALAMSLFVVSRRHREGVVS
jgi:hypothetical protein